MRSANLECQRGALWTTIVHDNGMLSKYSFCSFSIFEFFHPFF